MPSNPTDPSGLRYADTPTLEVDDWLPPAPERIWPHVIGLDAMVVGSAELQSARWLTEPALDGRFTGTNHRPDMGEWTTTCVVTAFEPGRAFGWDVYGDEDAVGGDPIASWRFTLTSERDGTRLAQWVRMGPGRSGVSMVIEARPELESKIVTRRLQEFERGMRANLAEIGRRAAG